MRAHAASQLAPSGIITGFDAMRSYAGSQARTSEKKRRKTHPAVLREAVGKQESEEGNRRENILSLMRRQTNLNHAYSDRRRDASVGV